MPKRPSLPHIPLPFKEVIADVLKVKPPERKKQKRNAPRKAAELPAKQKGRPS